MSERDPVGGGAAADTVRLLLSREEATALLLFMTLGTDAYDMREPEPQVTELLDRTLPAHLRGLDRKLKDMADYLGTTNGSE